MNRLLAEQILHEELLVLKLNRDIIAEHKKLVAKKEDFDSLILKEFIRLTYGEEKLAQLLLEAGLWDKIKYGLSAMTRHAKFRSGGKQAFFGLRKHEREAKKKYLAALKKASKNLIWGDLVKKLPKNFPNMYGSEEFMKILLQFGVAYDSIVADVKNGGFPAAAANELVGNLREVLKYFLDHKLGQMFRYKLEEEKEGRFTQAGKKGGLAQAGGSETMKLLQSKVLPSMLKKGGVVAALAGILLNADWFSDAVSTPPEGGGGEEAAAAATETITASQGGSFTAEVGALSAGDPTALGPTATLGDLQAAMSTPDGKGLEYYAALGANGPDAFMETWELATTDAAQNPLPPNTPLQEIFGVTQGGANPELLGNHGGPGMHPDLQLTGASTSTVGAVASAAASVAIGVAAKTGVVAGLGAAGISTGVLVPLGIAAVTGGYLVGWLRKKAAEEGGSRAELLAALIDEMPDVDEAGAPSEATPERPEEAAPGEEESAWGPPEYTDKDLLNTKNIWSFIEIYSAIAKQEGQDDDYGAVMTKKSLDEFASSRLPLSVPDAKKVAGYIQEKFQKHWIELLISSGTAAAKEEWDDWWDDRQEEEPASPGEEGEEDPLAAAEDWMRGADEAAQDVPGEEDLEPEEEEPEPGPEEKEPEGEEEPAKERQDFDYEDFWHAAKTYASKNPMIQDAFFKSPQAKRKLGAIFNLFKDLEPDKETYNFQDTERGPKGAKRRTDQVGALREGVDLYNIIRNKDLEKRPELKRLNVSVDDILLAIALFYQAYSRLPDNYFIFQGRPGKLSREKTRKKYLTKPPGGWRPELMDDDPNKPRDVKLKTPQGNVRGKESRGFTKTSARGAPLAPFEEHLKLQEQTTLNRWKVIAGIIKG